MVEGGQADVCSAIPLVDDAHCPGLTADFAVLHVLLGGAAAGIEGDLDALVAVRAVDDSIGRRGSIAQGKFFFEVVLSIGQMRGSVAGR